MNSNNLHNRLIRYIDGGFPIIYINSFEENKVDEIIRKVADKRNVLEWNAANGYVDFNTKVKFFEEYSLVDTLVLLNSKNEYACELERKLLILKDVAGSQLENDRVTALLKDLAIQINEGLDATIIIVSPILIIPKVLEKYIVVLEMDYLHSSEIKQIIGKFIAENCLSPIADSLMEEMAIAFKGLTEYEINNILSLSYADDGELSHNDLALIFEQKQQMIKKAGILEMVPLRESIDDIGGLENLKQWLERKAHIYKNINKAIAFGVDMPKGVLIAGVPGCGKSLNAKAAAKLFGVPLLRLDIGRLMGKYVGESEENMRKATALAEAISPCVLWIDELEKAFAGIGGSGGGAEVTTRLLGSFLTWMQEKDGPVFVVATANDISKLPPELLRKGRFDEIFYVGLPKDEERSKIFEIHIKKRRSADLNKINIQELVKKTNGYSGADIEGVVKESIEGVFADGRAELTTKDVLDTIQGTHSLSEIMKEPLERMSQDYKNRKFKNASR